MTRTKSPAQPAPQTLPEALALLGRYAAIDAQIAQVEADRQSAIANINRAADAAVEPSKAELKTIVLQLKPWWAVARNEILKAGRKSAKLGGCLIGYRMTPPKLHFDGGNDESAIAILSEKGWGQFVRSKLSIDKPAVITFLDGDHGSQLGSLGFQIRQREEFFVDRLAPKPAEIEAVEDPAEGEVA